jgi:endonuclease-3
MKRAEKAVRIRKILDEIYPDSPIPLRHRDPFTLLVAVLLSAQTTDARVNLVTPALFARASTPEEMAKLSVAEIHDLIRTCGLAPAKAKAIAGLSKILVEEHDGKVPRTFEELEALPGVGHKTASVVLAQAFAIPAFPVDTHIHRLAARWGLSDGSSVERTERDLKSIFPESAWIRLHLQIILFGREHCPALRHDFAKCPICSWAAPKRFHRAAEKPRTRAGATPRALRPPAKSPAPSTNAAPRARSRSAASRRRAPGSPAPRATPRGSSGSAAQSR